MFIPLNIAVLTVSDTRTPETDRSGDVLVERLSGAGHQLVARQICRDDCYQIRAVLSPWIAQDDLDIVLITGGTGVTGRDVTVEAVQVLFDKTLEGFGELFRQLSYQELGTSAIQSRATAGVANGTYLFAMPGSPNACRSAWDGILAAQLDARTKPCNFTQMLARLKE